MNRWLRKPIRINNKQTLLAKAVIHCLALGYLVILFYCAVVDDLGADPVEVLLHESGTWAVNLLLLTLFVSPLAKRIPFGRLMDFRRQLGVYSAVYAFFHFVVFVLFELQMNWDLLFLEIIERPYITVGFFALIILIVLTLTSPKSLKTSLGHKWQKIHNTIYLAASLALLHFTWSLKTGYEEPVFYWIVLALLFYWRREQFSRFVRKKGKKILA